MVPVHQCHINVVFRFAGVSVLGNVLIIAIMIVTMSFSSVFSLLLYFRRHVSSSFTSSLAVSFNHFQYCRTILWGCTLGWIESVYETYATYIQCHQIGYLQSCTRTQLFYRFSFSIDSRFVIWIWLVSSLCIASFPR